MWRVLLQAPVRPFLCSFENLALRRSSPVLQIALFGCDSSISGHFGSAGNIQRIR